MLKKLGDSIAGQPRVLWREAVQRGEIPGAYWATLTHPATTQALVRDAFGEVHMLSHLVGAANRADIRRLCRLEAENAEQRARLDRQELAFREAVVTRDACIRELSDALALVIKAVTVTEGAISMVTSDVVAPDFTVLIVPAI